MTAKELTVGGWVRRQQYATWHLVESIVADDAVTRCGRRMADAATVTGGGLVGAGSIVGDSVACRQCVPGRRVWPG